MPPTLGSFLPEPARRALIESSLKPGEILYLFCDFTTPKPKNKYLVLLDPIESPVLFLANSRINQYIAARPHLLNAQLQLPQASYKFLDHDSYLNCSEVIDVLPRKNIIDQLVADMDRRKGALTEADRSKVVELVRASQSISKIQKQRIIAALS